MKPITFENLRRLMGGGRKKKDRGESSFKRSDSFKRISIKRNYLDRGGRSRVPLGPLSKARGRASSRSRSPSPSASPPPAPPPAPAASPAPTPDPLVIGYGQWIRCQLRPKAPSNASTSTSSDERPPTPPPRRRGSSIAADSAIEILRLDRSPVVVRRRVGPADDAKEADGRDASRPDSAISINHGRVWLDAPLALAMAPRSLELPRPATQSATAPQAGHGGHPGHGAPPPGGPGRPAGRAHHSLDSALKESRRFLTPRALSSHARDSRITSSKDSGFSFSISIPRLADVSPASLSPPPGPPPHADSAGGFFRRRKKLSKPAPSVSRDGYFKRTSCASLASTASAASAASTTATTDPNPGAGVRRGSSRRRKGSGPGALVASARGSLRGSTRASGRGSTRGSGRRKKALQGQGPVCSGGVVVTSGGLAASASGTVRSDIYQVVVGRAPRSLHALKLDPMIFVAPEKRKPAATSASAGRRLPHRYEVQEIRGPFVPRDPAATKTEARDDTEEDEGLYECISPQSSGSPRASARASSVESLDRLDSLDEADTKVEAAPAAPAAPRRPSVTIKTKRNHVTRVMINMPSDRSSSSAGSDSDSDAGADGEGYAPPGYSPVPRCRGAHPAAARRPVQRRKSARKNVKYLAKPNIHRAPSTLRRARKCEYAALQRRVVAALDAPRTPRTPASESDGEWI